MRRDTGRERVRVSRGGGKKKGNTQNWGSAPYTGEQRGLNVQTPQKKTGRETKNKTIRKTEKYVEMGLT